MIEDFETVVTEIDEMLRNRDIDRLIKKHEKKTKNKKEEESLKKSDGLNPSVKISQNNTKEEIFELPTRRVRRTIEVSC